MTTLPKRVDTAVVGAGQAGLTMSWYLQQAGRDHVVLERGTRLGGGWLDRWDDVRLVGPSWTASFAGAPHDGADPDGFMSRDEIAGRVAGYAAAIAAPVILDARVRRLTTSGEAFIFPRQVRGVSDVPGLSFIGGLRQRDQLSATLIGLPRDARSLASHLGLQTAEGAVAG